MFDGRYKLTNWAEEISEKEIAPRALRQTGGPADDRLFALFSRSEVIASSPARMVDACNQLKGGSHASPIGRVWR